MAKTILVLAANPKDTPPLRLDEEIREIDNGLQRAQKRDEFILKQKLAVRPSDVRRAVLDYRPNIAHFCGHGSGEEGIALEDESGEAKLVGTEALSGFFELFAANLECVVLNACYSEVQAEAIAKHIPYVVGMKREIGDAAAIEFATAFYDALGAGESFEFAFRLARNAIQWANLPEHLTPVLKTKEQRNLLDLYVEPVGASEPSRETGASAAPHRGIASTVVGAASRRTFQVIALSALALTLFAGAFVFKWWMANPRSPMTIAEQTLPPLALYWHGFGQRRRGAEWVEFALRDGTTMYSGDQFRLAISPNEDCYLYIISLDANNTVTVLFPNEAIGMSNPVRAGEKYEIPDGRNWFTLDDRTGVETLYLLAGYDPLDRLDSLAGKIRSRTGSTSLREEVSTEINALAKSSETLGGQLRTRSGKVVVRGVNIQPDRRLASANLGNGQQVTQVMQFEPGALNVVKRIQILHEARP